MSKQVSLVEFNGIASAKMQYSDGSRSRETWHVVSMQSWVERALERGIKVEATGKRAKVRLVDILGTIPLPEEEEIKLVDRYHFKMRGGVSRPFITPEKAKDHYNKYCARLNYPWGFQIITNEVEVKA